MEPSPEADGISSTNANGDDNESETALIHGSCGAHDDEDGLTPPILTDGQVSPNVPVIVKNTTTSNAFLACWIDYSGTDFAASERSAIVTVPENATNATVVLPNVPVNASTTTGGNSFMRCRIASTESDIINPTGNANNGEIEDYPVSLIAAIPVVTPAPSIDIEKATNGTDADLVAEAVALMAGADVTWSYVVTNNGNESLNNISATDDKEGGITCPKTTLAVAEVMTCTSKTGVAITGDYANIASVSGTGDGSGTEVNDSDPSHYKAIPPAVTSTPPTPGTPAQPIPTLSEWARIILMLLLAGVTLQEARRRKVI